MGMDIKKMIEELAEKLKADDTLLEKFKATPVKALEELLGVDLPDDQINAVVAGVKAKLGISDAGDLLKGLGGLFGKK